jgi:hypothetical protein
VIHARYAEKEDRDVPLHERVEHYVTYDAYRRILFVNPTVEVLTDKDLATPESLAEWVEYPESLAEWVEYLFTKRGIYFAPVDSNAFRIREVMLKVYRPERVHCTGYNRLEMLPAL